MQIPSQPISRMIVDRDVCPYLPNRTSSMEFEFLAELSAADYSRRLARGWRRQGACLFRPVCRHCQECVSLRLSVEQFRPSRSQRRCLKLNADLRLVIREPTVTAQHLELFNTYHADMQRRRGWEFHEMTAVGYADGFLSARNSYAREFAYSLQNRLIAVGLVDCLNDCSSSIYFYHDPKLRPRGLGTYSLLCEVEMAKEAACKYHYLGYWVRDCPSMGYKSRFRPHELLHGTIIADDEQPLWEPR